MLIDTHTHLNHRQFTEPTADLLSRAAGAGVTRCVAPATDLASAARLHELALVHPTLHPAVGIHPCDADSVSGEAWIAELRALAQRPGTAAIGEVGLDYYHAPPEGFTPEAWKAQQSRVLRAQLDIAVELQLNAILHSRNCHDELIAEVLPYAGKLRAVFHCFSGTPEQAQQIIDMGHLVSFTGNVTYKNSASIQATAKALLPGQFMLETDSPYLAPMPHRGKRCEPTHVADTARFVAQLRGETLEQLAAHTTATAMGFFKGLDR